MKRLKDILGKNQRAYLREAFDRRREYYFEKWRSRFTRPDIIKSYLRVTPSPRLNLGCGGHLLEGWLNSDILGVCEGMIFLDVREEFPFEDGTFDFVFSEHLLEHLRYIDGIHLLEETKRVLKPGGTCRISTPDLAFLIDVYHRDSGENREYLKWAFDTYWPSLTASKAIAVNAYLTSWGHKCVYDFNLLEKALRDAGFIGIARNEVGKSHIADLTGLESHGRVITERWNRKESLVVEATKR